MKIGIYGGTFNPIHNGHLHVLREFYQRLGLNKLLLIPTYVPPHKPAPDLAPAAHRLEMCRLAAAGLEIPTQVLDIEVKRREKSYTVDTLAQLRGLYPGDEFFLLMGEDMFLTVGQWYQAGQIFAQCTVCASPRSSGGMARLEEQREALAAQYPGFRCRLEDIPFLDVSSTQIRAGESQAVPRPVLAYIRKNHLYQEEPNDH